METEMPRLLSRRPSDATVMPFPTDETTPPLTKTYRVTSAPFLNRSTKRGPAPRLGRRSCSSGWGNFAVYVTALRVQIWPAWSLEAASHCSPRPSIMRLHEVSGQEGRHRIASQID